MSAHAQQHRRAASAIIQRRQGPAFSPTAIFDQQLSTMTDAPGGTATTLSNTPPTSLPPPSVTSLVPPPTTPSTTSTPPVVTPPNEPPTTTTTGIDTAPVVTPTTTSTTLIVSQVTPIDTSTTPVVIRTTQSTSTTLSAPRTTTSASPSIGAPASSETAGESSGVSTGGIIGGVVGGILALAALFFIVSFFLRRARKRDEDATAFSAASFRRSAVLMNDPPTHEDTIAQGYNPRPPSMIERRLAPHPAPASPAPTFGTQYGAPGPMHYEDYSGGQGQGYSGGRGQGYGAADNYGQMNSFAPGQIMRNASPPHTATFAHPLFSSSAYGQSPFSPMSPASSVAPYDSAYNDRGEYVGANNAHLTRQPSGGANLQRQLSADSAVLPLSRQPSGTATDYPAMPQQAYGVPQVLHHAHNVGPAQYAHYPSAADNTTRHSIPMPTDDYVDLDRSSVTPYQAAQYAEISRRLNAEVPGGLDTPAVQKFVQGNMGSIQEDDAATLPNKPMSVSVSPFADPSNPQQDEFEFPAPPSPAHTAASSRPRIDSTPPMLPEIYVQPRVSVASYDFPNSVHGSAAPSPLGSGFPSGVAAGVSAGMRPPATPSPLASSFALPVSPAVENRFEDTLKAPAAARVPQAEGAPAPAVARPRPGEQKRPDTVYTVYDPEDAYGGI